MNLTKIIRLNKTIHTMGNHKSPQKGSETTGIFLELISEILNENVLLDEKFLRNLTTDSQNRTLSAASSGLLLYSRFRIIPLNFIFHAVGILSELDRMFPVDLAFKIQLNNSLIHGDHTQFPVGLHDAASWWDLPSRSDCGPHDWHA